MSEVKPLVSIICLAYNHEKYIEKAINSILSQKTTFDIEIIVSDDASTDNTTNILKNYQSQYPNLIKPVIHVINQYSQGLDIIAPLVKKAKGKYIAFCECDDYFTSDNKLETQAQFLEANSACVAYVHDAIKVNESDDKTYGIRGPYIQKKYLNTSDIIKSITSNYALNTLMVRSRCIQSLPNFYYTSPVKDIPLAIAISLQGQFYYSNDIMSAYRMGSIGSWSKRTGKSLNEINNYCSKIIQTLNEIDNYTEGKYQSLLFEKINGFEFWNTAYKTPIKVFTNKRSREYYNKLSLVSKVKILVRAIIPNFIQRKLIN